MRKHCPRKLLHACLDLLPVVLIPVFMIYSHRHDLTTGLPTVNFERKYNTNSLTDYNDIVVGNSYQFTYCFNGGWLSTGDQYNALVNNFGEPTNQDITLRLEYSVGDSSNANNVYKIDYFEYAYAFSGSLNISWVEDNLSFNDDYYYLRFSFEGGTTNSGHRMQSFRYYKVDHYSLINGSNSRYVWCMGLRSIVTFTGALNLSSSQLTNLNSAISNGYLTAVQDAYNPILSADVDYADSTVTNVFMNNFSTTVNTYLNFGNVFNLNGMWNWINTNIFGGTANAFVYALWNIIVYEFVMDLLFLFYMFFMFLIDFTENLLEKPFDKINRG